MHHLGDRFWRRCGASCWRIGLSSLIWLGICGLGGLALGAVMLWGVYQFGQSLWRE